MFVFILCNNDRDFKKWMKTLPEIFKGYKIPELTHGDPNQIGLNFEPVDKTLPVKFDELENLKNNSEFVINDSQGGKIELFRRINEKYKMAQDNFQR